MMPIADSDRPHFLADENFNGRIVVGLRRLYPEIDLLTFVEANIARGLSDPELIEETAHLDRILLTHDKRTMPDHFADVLARTLPLGLHLPGVLLLSRTMAIGAAIDEIALIWGASRHDEYRNRIVYLPNIGARVVAYVWLSQRPNCLGETPGVGTKQCEDGGCRPHPDLRFERVSSAACCFTTLHQVGVRGRLHLRGGFWQITGGFFDVTTS